MIKAFYETTIEKVELSEDFLQDLVSKSRFTRPFPKATISIKRNLHEKLQHVLKPIKTSNKFEDDRQFPMQKLFLKKLPT